MSRKHILIVEDEQDMADLVAMRLKREGYVVDVAYDGDQLEIGFNARYFIDVLGVLDTEEIRVELSGTLDPIVVQDIEKSFIGVIMPMRI